MSRLEESCTSSGGPSLVARGPTCRPGCSWPRSDAGMHVAGACSSAPIPDELVEALAGPSVGSSQSLACSRCAGDKVRMSK